MSLKTECKQNNVQYKRLLNNKRKVLSIQRLLKKCKMEDSRKKKKNLYITFCDFSFYCMLYHHDIYI